MSRILGDVFQILNGNVGLGTTLPRQRFDIENGHVILQGNLGIGTTNPLYALDTRGDINFSGILRQNGTPYVSSQWSTNGTNLYYNDGNVGIGTNLPQSPLHIIGDIRSSQTIYASNLQITGLTIEGTVTSNTQQLTVINNGTGPALIVKQTGINYIAEFYHDDNVVLTLADGGLIGINTATPRAPLDIIGDTILTGNIGFGTTQALARLYVRHFDTGTDDIFRVDNTNANTTSLIVDHNGNVGIGTSQPKYSLDVYGNAKITGSVTAGSFIGTATQVSQTLVRGAYLTGANYNGSVTTTWAVDADSANTAGKIVVRDASGNFSAGTITATALSGTAITDSTSTTSSSTAASATAVKSAYDLAGAALPKTGGLVSGDVTILANLTASNLTVIGESTILNTITSNTEQMVITNDGTGPALKVTQSGAFPVAEFYDNESGLAMTIANNGNIGIGSTTPFNKLDVLGNVYVSGTITGTLSGTAIQVSQDLVRGAYLTGTNYNGAGTTTWAVDADSANTAGKVVVRDGSGNFSAGTITGTLSGTATQVSQDLVKGAYLTGTNYNGAGTTTWAVDATTSAAANKVAVRDSLGALYANYLGINTSNLSRTVTIGGDIYVTNTAIAQKLLIRGTEPVLYPPAFLTTDSETLSGYSYGNGTYTVTESSSLSSVYKGWKMFNGASNTPEACWATNVNLYTDTGGGYIGSTSTVIDGRTYYGEWAQIQMPVTTILSSYEVAPRIDDPYYTARRSPRTWYLAGSSNGSSWSMVDVQTSNVWVHPNSKIVDVFVNTKSFSYYRLIVNEVGNVSTSNDNGAAFVGELKLYGRTSNDGTMIVYGDTVLNGRTLVNTLTASNIGIGTTMAIYPLHVEGNTYLNGSITTNNNNINAGTGTITAATFTGTATQVSQDLVKGAYLTGTNYNGAGTTTWDVDATSSNIANKVVARDINGNFSAGTITATLNGTATQVSSTLVRGAYLTGTNFNGAGTTTWAVDADSANTANKVVVRDASGNFSAGTITAILSGTATQVGQDLVRGVYLTGTNYNGAVATTWAVDADSANVANKVVVRDASGNFSAGTIAATLNGTATKVSQDLVKGAYLTGTNYNGAGTTTWAVDADSANTANKVVVRDASGNFSAGTITATLSGTATKVGQDLVKGAYLTGTNYNGAGTTTWAVDADSANTANKVVVRDASGNFSAGTITATLTGTATQVSSTLTRGSYLTGNDFTGASPTTWAVDATTTATANKVVVRDASAGIYVANIGIGTTTALYPVDVVGDINFTGILRQSGTPYISSQWTTNGTNLYYNDGNVGIGTNLPQSQLHVIGDIRASQTIYASNLQVLGLTIQDTITSNTQQLTVINNGTGPALIVKQTGVNYIAEFYHNDDVILALADGGLIGINTATPRAPLDIIGDTILTGNIGFGTTQALARLYVRHFDTGTDDIVRVDNTNTNTTSFMVNHNGNVGIGTSQPNTTLDVYGNVNITGTITANALSGSAITNSTSTTSSTIAASATAVKSAYDLAGAALPKTGGLVTGDITILANLTASNLTVIGESTILNTITSNTEQMVITNAGTGPALKVTQSGAYPVAEFYDNESGLAMTISNDGNIGIGSTTPFNKLDVIGDAYVSGIITGTLSGTATKVSQDLVKGVYLTGSDYNGSVTTTWDVDATTTATANKIVARDASGYLFANGVGIGTGTARQILDVQGGHAIVSGNVGVGTTDPLYTIDVIGDINFTGTLYQNGIVFSGGGGGSSQWTTNGTSIYYNLGNVGIGITNPQYKLDISGNMHIGNSLNVDDTITTSNLVVLNAYTTDYQIAPARKVTYVDPGPSDTFVVSVDGYFGGAASNVHVFVDNHKLTYYTDAISDYQLAITYDTIYNKTNYTVTLTTPATFGKLVDITVWPQILQESLPNPMRLYQHVNIEYTTPTNTALQVSPVRKVFYVESASQSAFNLTTSGIYGGEASNAQIFVGQSLLSYYSSNITDYTLNYIHNSTDTIYTVTLTNPVDYASIVDITIWPTIISSSNIIGSVHQIVNVTNLWERNSTDIYYNAGNVGIGTTNPQSPLHVEGPITAGNTPFKVYTASGILSASGVELSVSLPTNTTVNSIFSLSGMTSNTANGDWIGFTTNNIYGGSYLDWNVGHYIHYTSNVIRLVPTATTAGKPFKLCIMSIS